MTPSERQRAEKETREVLAAKRASAGRDATSAELARWADTFERIALIMRERAVVLQGARLPREGDPVGPTPEIAPARAKVPKAPRAMKGQTLVPKRRAPSQVSPGPKKPQPTPEEVLANRPGKPPGHGKGSKP